MNFAIFVSFIHNQKVLSLATGKELGSISQQLSARAVPQLMYPDVILSEGELPRALTGAPSTPAFRVLEWSCAGNPSRRILGYFFAATPKTR